VPRRASAAVALSIDCGPDCRTAVDITAPLAAASGVWRRLAIPWRCLVPQGGSLAALDTLAITTAGSLTLSLTDVGLERRVAPGQGCLQSD
jgi:hypothetical protein